MEMDLRLTFNEDAPNYDKLRPTYTDELFDDTIRFSSLSRNKRVLEIGIGTGQATLPFLKTGCKVTAIEIGDKLAQFSREKFTEFKSFEVINQDFESVQLDENAYDLVYSASAFHWIPQEIGLPKIYGLLKSGGVFAWFSIQPVPAQEHTHIHEALMLV
jgi:16S rRNA A1518/A1519 N6-dimethyltransferase RsmA/KsgA/DIM1 with predicted DNA glycosylase/AP lyase activity